MGQASETTLSHAVVIVLVLRHGDEPEDGCEGDDVPSEHESTGTWLDHRTGGGGGGQHDGEGEGRHQDHGGEEQREVPTASIRPCYRGPPLVDEVRYGRNHVEHEHEQGPPVIVLWQRTGKH